MFRKVMYNGVGLLCGFFYINGMPDVHPINFSEFLIELVLNPVRFFMAMLSFFIGFLAYSNLIRNSFELTYALIKKRTVHPMEFVLSYLFLGGFFLLFQLSVWHTLIFLCFSLIYGMISIDFKNYRDTKMKNNG